MSPMEGKPLLNNNSYSAPMRSEEKRRQRLCLALTLFCSLCIFFAAVSVWYYRETRYRHADAKTRAADSMDYLNQRLGQAMDDGTVLPKGCETTLVVLRHCEKNGPSVMDDDGNDHCSYIGYERSYYIRDLFGNDPDSRWPLPTHLFAWPLDREMHNNYREYETLLPLSKKSGVTIELPEPSSIGNKYFDLLMSSEVCGTVTVISWKHESMAELAVQLGCGPEDGCPQFYDENDFDSTWLLKYVYHTPLANHYDSPSDPNKDVADQLVDDVVDASDVDAAPKDGHGRILRYHSRNKSTHLGRWSVYASVVKQGFDQLSYSKRSGDYPEGGAPRGGGWRSRGKREL